MLALPSPPAGTTTDIDPNPAGADRLWFHRAAPAHADALHDLYERMSPEARRSRFFTAMPRVPRSIAGHVCSADPARNLVWLARAGDSLGPVIGEVQAVIERDDPTSAEIAVAVEDAWTGRGIGRRLVTLIHAVAARHGVETFLAEVLPDNRPSLELLSSFGMTFGFSGGVLAGRGPVHAGAEPVWTAVVPRARVEDLARTA